MQPTLGQVGTRVPVGCIHFDFHLQTRTPSRRIQGGVDQILFIQSIYLGPGLQGYMMPRLPVGALDLGCGHQRARRGLNAEPLHRSQVQQPHEAGPALLGRVAPEARERVPSGHVMPHLALSQLMQGRCTFPRGWSGEAQRRLSLQLGDPAMALCARCSSRSPRNRLVTRNTSSRMSSWVSLISS